MWLALIRLVDWARYLVFYHLSVGFAWLGGIYNHGKFSHRSHQWLEWRYFEKRGLLIWITMSTPETSWLPVTRHNVNSRFAGFWLKACSCLIGWRIIVPWSKYLFCQLLLLAGWGSCLIYSLSSPQSATWQLGMTHPSSKTAEAKARNGTEALCISI